MAPKILLLDIETAPNSAYIWSLWKEVYTMDMVENEWYILCWCAKWLGVKGVHGVGLPDYPKLYNEDPANDKGIMRALWELLDKADVVVAHNASQFDVKRINTRFLAHGMKPPSPYRVVDTLKLARRHFAFTSNRLDDLGRTLGVGRKRKTGGFKLWSGCLAGDGKCWTKMLRYCKQDVLLLERVYKALIPFSSGTPNLGLYGDEFDALCPRCGSRRLQKRGTAYTSVSRFQRFQCQKCGGWSRSRLREGESVELVSA